MKKIIFTEEAPKAVGPYSQGVKIGNMLFVSGQIPMDASTGKIVEGDITKKLNRVMQNINAILKAANMSFDDVVQVTIFLKNFQDFAAVNEAYAKYFKGDFPSRVTIEVSGLPLNSDIEISCIAVA